MELTTDRAMLVKREAKKTVQNIDQLRDLVAEIETAPKDRFGNMKCAEQNSVIANHFKDQWAGKMMSVYPKVFENLRLQSIVEALGEANDLIAESFYCRNCMREIETSGNYKFWYDKNLGFFCNSCLLPTNGGVQNFIKCMKKYSLSIISDFIGQDVLKDNCITYNNKQRPKKPCIGFADKDKKESAAFILPQKW